MSTEVPIPQWVPATATRFGGGSAIGLSPVRPCYQVDAGRGGNRYIVLTEREAEAVCKAVLKDIRKHKAGGSRTKA